MPEEHGGDLGFSYRWQEIQARNEIYVPLTVLEPGVNQYDKDMFLSVWGPIVASLLYSKSC
jgi:hypothetical protein